MTLKILDSDGILGIEIQLLVLNRKIEIESADGFCLMFSNSPVSILLNSEILQEFFKKTLTYDSSNRISIELSVHQFSSLRTFRTKNRADKDSP